MRSLEEIEAEIQKLRDLLALKDRWNVATRQAIEAQVEALSEHLTIPQAERRWWMDESDEDYNEGDNDICHEVCRAIEWMNGSKGAPAPSSEA